jgi:hypothetical protein
MMSNNRAEYGSASEWLSALKQDELWLSQLQQLGAPSADRAALREAALRKIGQTLTFEYWDSYGHRVEPVVSEVWEIAELTLPKLKIQTIGMLAMEWLEQQEKTDGHVQQGSGSQSGLTGKLASEEAMRYWKRLQQEGFVDERCQLKQDTTRKQAMYIAEVFAERLGIGSKWKTFERLWGISNLAQEKWDFQQTGTLPSRSKEIDRIFED